MATTNSTNRLQLSLETGTIIKTIVILALAYILYYIRDLILVILVSVVIASAIEPATRWLARFKVSRVLAVLFVYLAIFGFLVALFPLFIQPVAGDLIAASASIPERIGTISAERLSQFLGGVPVGDLAHGLQSFFRELSQGFLQTTSAIFGGFFSFVLIVIISFYLAVQPDGVGDFLRIVVPTRHEAYALDLWRRARSKIGLWMQGQILLGLLVGIIVYLGLVVLGVDYALVLALIAALFELIPVFGPILSAVPAVLIGFTVSPAVGLMVLGLYIIVQQFENHLLYPLVVKKIVGVPSLIVILALIIGSQLAGFFGIILAVPLAAAAMELANDLEDRKRARAERHEA